MQHHDPARQRGGDGRCGPADDRGQCDRYGRVHHHRDKRIVERAAGILAREEQRLQDLLQHECRQAQAIDRNGLRDGGGIGRGGLADALRAPGWRYLALAGLVALALVVYFGFGQLILRLHVP